MSPLNSIVSIEYFIDIYMFFTLETHQTHECNINYLTLERQKQKEKQTETALLQ